MSHIVESCPLTKLNGGLSRLHSADETLFRGWPVVVHDTHMRNRRSAARSRRCPTLLNPVFWQNWMVVYLGYTLQMNFRCFVADQLWVMTRIREEEVQHARMMERQLSGSRNMKNMVHGRSFLRQMLHRGHQFISYRHLRLADTLMLCHACTGRMLLLVLNCGMVSQPCCVSWTVLWHCWLGHTTRKSLQNDLWCVNWDVKPCCAVSSADQVTCTA